VIILGVTIGVLLVVAVGLAVARKVDGDSTNFLVAGRSLALPLAAAGLMGQAVDSNATLGNTDLSYGLGFWAGASLPLGLALCLLLTGIFFAARMNRMKLLSLPDFYRIKYGRGIELAASVLMIFSFCILLAGNLVAGGFLFERFLGTSYLGGVLIIVAVVLTYTLTGGMFSDAYTAFVQMCITVIGSFSLFIWVAIRYGISVPEGMGPFDLGQLSDPSQGAMINWATLISLGIGDIIAIDFMQRIFSARSPDIARRACFVAAAGTAIVGIPYALVALSMQQVLGPDAEAPVLLTVLGDLAPAGLAILVLSAIIAASCSTANGAILGTAAVAVRNIAGVEPRHSQTERDPLLRTVRLTMPLVVLIAILFAWRVPQTGILLTLAFDLMLACLIVPFVFGHFWSRASTAAAAAAIAVGLVVRMVLFVFTPTMYGVENTLIYVPTDVFGPGFDGWPTFIAAFASLAAFVVVALARTPEAAPASEPAPVPELVPALAAASGSAAESAPASKPAASTQLVAEASGSATVAVAAAGPAAAIEAVAVTEKDAESTDDEAGSTVEVAESTDGKADSTVEKVDAEVKAEPAPEAPAIEASTVEAEPTAEPEPASAATAEEGAGDDTGTGEALTAPADADADADADAKPERTSDGQADGAVVSPDTRAEITAELKEELKAELKSELKAELLEELRSEVAANGRTRRSRTSAKTGSKSGSTRSSRAGSTAGGEAEPEPEAEAPAK
jgi:SSS family solute:Na+ symporter